MPKPIPAEKRNIEESASLACRATKVVDCATAFIARRLNGLFTECVSVGVMGSYARNLLSEASDIDYYVIFDISSFAAKGIDFGRGNMSEITEALVSHVRCEFPTEPLASRFSVYWTSLECLEANRYDLGRWPRYDRMALANHGVRLGGKAV